MVLKAITKIVVLWFALYFLFTIFLFYNPYKLLVRKPANIGADFVSPSRSFENIFWFIQVSDIHVSKFRDAQRVSDLEQFCMTTVKIINPDFVIVTGDLTDAKHKNYQSSTQFESEWMAYQNVLRKTNVTNKFVWIDVRGNHDAFDVLSNTHKQNLYLKYSADKGKRSSHSWTHVKSFGNYTFIPVDATLVPGPKRPFNFVGYLSETHLNKLQKEGEDAVKSNFTFWYGHYPTSVITSQSLIGIRSLIGRFGDVYLSGHFHDMLGLVPAMYGMHSSGFLELELKDWMRNRAFRIVAVDHDLMSFTDVLLHDWPVILITNPKPATYMIPNHEPIARMTNSTHVRFLIFSPKPIKYVSVSVNGVALKEIEHVQGPLWITKYKFIKHQYLRNLIKRKSDEVLVRWNASSYMHGLHHLVVSVEDKAGNKKSATSDFSLDDHWTTNFSVLALVFILSDLANVVRTLFLLIVFVLFALLFTIRWTNVVKTDGPWFKLRLLVLDNITYTVTLLYLLNLLFGPLFIGELLSDRMGVCFSYGLLIEGKLTSEHTIYLFCIWNLLWSFIPVLSYLALSVDRRWAKKSTFGDCCKLTMSNLRLNLLLVAHIAYQCFSFKNLTLAYGWRSALLSPVCLWWSVGALFLVWRTWTRNVTVLRPSRDLLAG